MTEALDQFGRVERLGIEQIPESDRHGSPKELFSIWFSANTAYLYIVLGGILVLSGLPLWEAALAAVIGNLFYLLIGLAAISGRDAGTSTLRISALHYGTTGNIVSTGINWINDVGFEAINLAFGTFAAVSLVHQFGEGTGLRTKIACLLVLAILTFALAILGHATIVAAQRFLSVALGLVAVGLILLTLPHVHLDYRPTHAHGSLSIFLVGVSIIATGPLSWIGGAADYTRYLPKGASTKRIVMWTSLGGFIPSTVLCILGVLLGTAINMTNPISSIEAIVPSWFYYLFLLLVILGSMSNNVLGIYGSGLTLQAMGIRVRRSRTVLIDCAVGGAMTLYAVFIADFTTTLSNFLQLELVWFAPFAAIFIVDLLLRRQSYEAALTSSTVIPRVAWGGLLALGSGMVGALLFTNSTYWIGPGARFIGGADISPEVGMVLAGTVYWWWMRSQRRNVPSALPAAEVAVVLEEVS